MNPTWQELTKLEPRLSVLLKQARNVQNTGTGFCANAVWYRQGGLRNELRRLVGWRAERDNPTLRSQAAYAVAYRKVYQSLPPCQECNCL